MFYSEKQNMKIPAYAVTIPGLIADRGTVLVCLLS